MENMHNKGWKARLLHLPLLPRIIIAIILGVVAGSFVPGEWLRVFATFNGIFSQLLGFLIPLIIIGLVTPAIADIGESAGRLLVVTVLVAYLDTVVAAFVGYGTGEALFPSLVAGGESLSGVGLDTVFTPYFTVKIPPMTDVMSALVFAFVAGLGIAYSKSPVLKSAAAEGQEIISLTISKAIIPLLPLYIFGIFVGMAVSGDAMRVMSVFAKIIVVIFVLHVFILVYEYFIAGLIAKRNPLRLLLNMLPAYFTALGTSSSAATIPVTLRQTEKNGVSRGVAGFVVPLCATIHLSGSAMKITACALTVCLLGGMPHGIGHFTHFILMLGIVMVAAPGVPGGAIMAALAPLESILGFDPNAQALMIALYIAMDSFGTACNVTGDGAIAVALNRFFAPRRTTAVPESTDA